MCDEVHVVFAEWRAVVLVVVADAESLQKMEGLHGTRAVSVARSFARVERACIGRAERVAGCARRADGLVGCSQASTTAGAASADVYTVAGVLAGLLPRAGAPFAT
ncbi:hypothetical protein WS71_04575 [Burkholderia mayonis]|uniref:Uncharacterized protein n=1 Tax=Burkholderia mayonis TaxID=1385591 RepID=A0A1B4FSK7_9BURK|nr:hypothetical protein WS71_04575 [Burkholderia mayonis]